MPLVNCKNKRSNCGPIVASTCISYENDSNDVIKTSELPCDANLDDVFDKLSEIIADIKSSIDLSKFDKKSLNFDKKTQKVKDLLQELTDKIKDLQDGLSSQINKVNSLDASNLTVNMNLDSLSSQVNPYIPNTTIYSISSILKLFKNEIILIKSKL